MFTVKAKVQYKEYVLDEIIGVIDDKRTLEDIVERFNKRLIENGCEILKEYTEFITEEITDQELIKEYSKSLLIFNKIL